MATLTKFHREEIPNFFLVNDIDQHVHNVRVGTSLGTSNPGWRSKVSSGLNATSDYTIDAFKVETAIPASFEHKTVVVTGYPDHVVLLLNSFGRFSGFYLNANGVGFNHAVAIPPLAEQEALKRAYDSIREHNSGVNGLLILGELRETIHQIRHPAESLRKGLSDFLSTLKSTRSRVQRQIQAKKSDTDRSILFRRLNAVKKAIAGTWLEFQFGVRPTLQDTADVAKTAIAALTGQRATLRLKSSSDKTRGVSIPVSGNVIYGQNLRVTYNVSISTVADIRFTIGVKKTFDGPLRPLENLSKSFGLTLENFVPTIWELAPWSFFIDYFINVGDVLSAASTDLSDVVFASKSRRQSSKIWLSESYSGKNDVFANGAIITQAIGGKLSSFREIRYTTLSRANSWPLPWPQLSLSIPGLTSLKWANIGALIAQGRDFRFSSRG